MTTNQEARQAALRAITSAAEPLPSDWHALWDAQGIAAGTWNERMLAWCNTRLSASYTSVPEAMAAYAANQGFDNWNSVGAGVDFVGADPATGNPIGLLLALTYNIP